MRTKELGAGMTDARDALRKLRNEVAGLLGAWENDIRAAVGVTNVNTLKLRVQEADAALLSASASEPVPIDATIQREIARLNAESHRWETPSATEAALYEFARFVLARQFTASEAPGDRIAAIPKG